MRSTALLALAVTCAGSAAGAPTTETIAAIDERCDAAGAFAVEHSDAGHVFWDVSFGLIPAAGSGLWWRVDRIERWAVADSLGAHGPNSQVSVWTLHDVTLATAFFSSDSGDWAFFVDYCYRPDGTLARTSSTFNSFVAANVPDGIHRERTRYFGRRGNVLASRTSVSSLATGQVLRIRVEGDEEPPYLSLEKLPFFPLLRAVRAR